MLIQTQKRLRLRLIGKENMKKICLFLMLVLFFSSCSKEQSELQVYSQTKQKPKATKYHLDTFGVDVVDNTMVYSKARNNILKPVYFDFDSFNIRQDMLPSLLASIKVLEKNKHQNIVLKGFCDDLGSFQYNKILGLKRANSVRDFLVLKGIKHSRIQTISYGKSRSNCFGKSPLCYVHSRRVEITLKF